MAFCSQCGTSVLLPQGIGSHRRFCAREFRERCCILAPTGTRTRAGLWRMVWPPPASCHVFLPSESGHITTLLARKRLLKMYFIDYPWPTKPCSKEKHFPGQALACWHARSPSISQKVFGWGGGHLGTKNKGAFSFARSGERWEASMSRS